MKGYLLLLGVFALLFAGCTGQTSTGAGVISSYPPGYQAARDGLVVGIDSSFASTTSFWNNVSGRDYIVTGLVISDNGTHAPVLLQYCAAVNTSSPTSCPANWSTIMSVYSPVAYDMIDAPIKIGYGAGLRTNFTVNGTTGFVHIRYLNMTQ